MEATGSTAATTRTGQDLHRGRILVADDDADLRRLVTWTLRKEGYEVVEAADGMEFIDCLEATAWNPACRPFDAIVSDVKMPGLSGLDLLALFRCTVLTTPIILMTAFADAETRSEAEALGATALLDKPLDLATLRAAVARALPPS